MMTLGEALNDPAIAATLTHGGPRPRPLGELLAALDQEEEATVPLPVAPATVAGKPVAAWRCTQLLFVDMVEGMARTKTNGDWKVQRLYDQVLAMDEQGCEINLTREEFGKVPYRTAKALMHSVELFGTKMGLRAPATVEGDLLDGRQVIRLSQPYEGQDHIVFLCDTLADLETLAMGGAAVDRLQDLLSLSDMPDALHDLTVADGTFILKALGKHKKQAKKVLEGIRSFEEAVGQFPPDTSLRRIALKQEGFNTVFKKKNAAQRAAQQNKPRLGKRIR